MKPELFLSTALKLAEDAAAAVMELYKQPLDKQQKEDKSIVTEADFKADEIIKTGLSKAFPDHGIVTEESGIMGKPDSEYVWLVDPLDGTKAFAKGIAGFSIMVGLLKHGRPYLGVVVDPIQGKTYEAVHGKGAFVTSNNIRHALKVSARADYTEMRLVVSTGFPEIPLNRLREELHGPMLDPINSVGIKVGHLVCQEGDVYVNHHPVHLWDTCAPQIILEEAGGLFTKLDGTPLEYELTPPYSHQALTIATNGQRHQDLIAMMAANHLFV